MLNVDLCWVKPWESCCFLPTFLKINTVLPEDSWHLWLTQQILFLLAEVWGDLVQMTVYCAAKVNVSYPLACAFSYFDRWGHCHYFFFKLFFIFWEFHVSIMFTLSPPNFAPHPRFLLRFMTLYSLSVIVTVRKSCEQCTLRSLNVTRVFRADLLGLNP